MEIGKSDSVLNSNIITTFARELMDFINDIGLFFKDIISSIHHFLNKFMADDAILMFSILLGAIIAIFIFRLVINKR